MELNKLSHNIQEFIHELVYYGLFFMQKIFGINLLFLIAGGDIRWYYPKTGSFSLQKRKDIS
ncbi:hypothetical protein B4079_1142 [Bacillus cereus]|nr:hypothetical protein B4079_1142 [Bacillus cereus]